MIPYITFIQGLLLIKLLLAHTLTDFVFQPTAWIKDKRVKKNKSIYLYIHSAIAGASSYILLAQWHNWQVPLVIAVTHYFIDLWKLKRPDNLLYFIIDQVLHVTVIVTLWFYIICNWAQFEHWLLLGLSNYKIWIVILGFMIVVFPSQYIIALATKKWSDALKQPDNGDAEDTLEDAGKWVGIFERVLIFILVLYNQYEAIGFLIAAKSFIRFSEKTDKTRALTEYILIGTLISFTIAIVVGIFISHLFSKYN